MRGRFRQGVRIVGTPPEIVRWPAFRRYTRSPAPAWAGRLASRQASRRRRRAGARLPAEEPGGVGETSFQHFGCSWNTYIISLNLCPRCIDPISPVKENLAHDRGGEGMPGVQALPTASVRRVVGVPGSNSAQRVLIADDDPLIRKLLQTIFTRKGCSLKIVDNGTSAIEECSKGGYSVLILDLELGTPNGFEVIAGVRATGNQIPIVLMSGSFTVDTLPTFPAAQRVVCLAKPFDIVALDAAIKRVT
jgi:CheY-like chemotaxis protein